MSTGQMAMLAGVFLVPLMLLWAGHRLRRRSSRWRGAFWGGLLGHLLAIVVGSVAAMTPAAEWSLTDVWRGALGFWSFVVAPTVGALIGGAWGSRHAA